MDKKEILEALNIAELQRNAALADARDFARRVRVQEERIAIARAKISEFERLRDSSPERVASLEQRIASLKVKLEALDNSKKVKKVTRRSVEQYAIAMLSSREKEKQVAGRELILALNRGGDPGELFLKYGGKVE